MIEIQSQTLTKNCTRADAIVLEHWYLIHTVKKQNQTNTVSVSDRCLQTRQKDAALICHLVERCFLWTKSHPAKEVLVNITNK